MEFSHQTTFAVLVDNVFFYFLEVLRYKRRSPGILLTLYLFPYTKAPTVLIICKQSITDTSEVNNDS